MELFYRAMLLINPTDLPNPGAHGMRLIGWGQSVKAGEIVKFGCKNYSDFYPFSVKNKKPVNIGADICMAAHTMRWLCPNMPKSLQLFMKGCLLGYAGSVWDLRDEFSEVLVKEFGPAKFVSLNWEN